MAPKEEKSSRSVLPRHLATGDTNEDHRSPTFRMDDGRSQPAANYRRTESIINFPGQRDNLVPKDPGIVSPEKGVHPEFPVFYGLTTLHSRPGDHELLLTVAFGMNEGFILSKPELLTIDGNPLNYWRFVTNF